jgi:hypothetical protein
MASARERIGREIDLPLPTAIWVLGIHVVTILSPLLVVWVVAANRATLDDRLDRPALLYVYAVLLIVASVCESAQNTADRWYLYGVPPSLLDLMFNTLVALGLAVSVLAVYGDALWVWVAVLAVWALFPIAYVMDWPTAPVQAVLGVASVAALYVALDEPVVVLSLVTVFLTLYFLDLLVRTRQQVFHGFTTGVNAVGLLATVAAISWAGSSGGWPWWVVVAVAVAVVAVAIAVRPVLLRAGPTPRKPAAPVEVEGPNLAAGR